MKIVFAGTPEFALPTLEALLDSRHRLAAVYTQPDRPAGRGRKHVASPVKRIAVAHDIPLVQPRSFADEGAVEQLAEFECDLMVVVAYGLLLPQPVLDLPRLGCINIHASLLPRWRGAAPIQRAILAGDDWIGVTLMQMERRLDAGPILRQARCPIAPDASASDLHARLAGLGAETLMEALPAIEAGTLRAQPQDEAAASYAAKIEKSEALIDWSRSAIELERCVRAFNPWPVAYTSFERRRLRIWQARALDRAEDAAPGTVLDGESGRMDVATGEGILRLVEVQLAGRQRMPVRSFLNAHRVAGVRLGSP